MVLRWFWREERLLAEKEFSSDRFQWLHREEAIKENLEVLGNLLEPEDPGTLANVQKVVGDILRQNNVQLETGTPALWGLCDLVNRALAEQRGAVANFAPRAALFPRGLAGACTHRGVLVGT